MDDYKETESYSHNKAVQYFWEPCSLVSDQHITNYMLSKAFLRARHLWKWILTCPGDRVGIFKFHATYRFFSHFYTGDSLGGFSFYFVSHIYTIYIFS